MLCNLLFDDFPCLLSELFQLPLFVLALTFLTAVLAQCAYVHFQLLAQPLFEPWQFQPLPLFALVQQPRMQCAHHVQCVQPLQPLRLLLLECALFILLVFLVHQLNEVSFLAKAVSTQQCLSIQLDTDCHQ